MTPDMSGTEKQSLQVNMDWLFNTSIEKLWQAWTDPSILNKWFGSDPSGIVLCAVLDVRPGGPFEIEFMDSDDTRHTCFGVYTEVEMNFRLHFTWSWKSEPGHRSYVKVELKKMPRGAHMQFEHGGLNPGSAHNYETGWKNTFLKLEGYLNKESITAGKDGKNLKTDF